MVEGLCEYVHKPCKRWTAASVFSYQLIPKVWGRFYKVFHYYKQITGVTYLTVHNRIVRHFYVVQDIYIYIYIYIYKSTSTTLSRRLTIHLSDTNSIARHLKKHSCSTTELRKFLPKTILKQQKNKQKLQILEALDIKNIQPKLIELILKPVLMHLNVFGYWFYL